ncbi:MAG: hypothetical protein J0H74_11170 [Chitinophagaceae bacterium]|nr:hypothetical protein [Chitinophagaceae bacterium]
MNNKINILLVVTVVIWGIACKKYDLAPEKDKQAYLRIYNDIPYTLDATSKGQPLPFLTFLLDPKMDGKGIPENADILGDFLTTRQIYSISYPINAGNVTEVVNYDYPGRAHVPAAPPINGLDLSAWAQIPSGKHRVMFVTRPFTDTPFINLPAKAREKIMIDTTIDFQAGEVYTMETVAKDLDKAHYGLYLRKESFIHEKFEDDKIYVSMYNLSGERSLYYPSIYCQDTLNAWYSYLQWDDISNGSSVYIKNYIPLSPYIGLPLPPLRTRFPTSAPFAAMPSLSRDYFFDFQGVLRTYSPLIPAVTSELGTLPFAGIHLRDAQGNFVKKSDNFGIFTDTGNFRLTMYAVADPARVNQIDPDYVTNNGIEQFPALANFNLITSIDGKVNISNTINILELVYGRVYQIQIQKLYPSPYTH